MKKLFLIISFILAAVGMSLGQTTTTLTPDKGSATYSAQAITNNNLISLLGSQSATHTSIYNELSNMNKDGDTTNQTLRLLQRYENTPGLKYEFEWYPGTTTYSATNSVVMGTLSVTAFSITLPTGFYRLSYVLLGDIGSALASGYNLWIYDSIPQTQTDNVTISNNQSYSKRNLIYSIPLTSQIINDSGRLFYNGSNTGYGQTYTSEVLFSGTIYYLITVAGGTPYANGNSAKNIRFYFKKVAD